MDTTRNEIYLAALLHDIGKFYQRADEAGVDKSKYLSQEVKNLETVFCPLFKGITSHKHVLWTAQFFTDFESHLKNLFNKDSKAAFDGLLRLAAIHHFPDKQNLAECIIQKADHYASGADRSSEEHFLKDTEEEADKAWDSFKRIKMRSVFEGISLKYTQDEPWHANYKAKLPLKVTELSGDYFPMGEDNSLPDYHLLWEEFTREVKFIQTDSFKTFSETLLSLLEKYTSRIPGSTVHLPDVSLYDHSKMTAGFAVCLFDYLESKKQTELSGAGEKPFVLIGGDLSGIQKFIYGIIARGAAKNLKGRSFYLQLLLDNIVKSLLEKLNLFDANIVYNSGGSFYIIAPNISGLPNVLEEFERNIAEKLFEFHAAELYLCLDYEPFGEDEIIVHLNKAGKVLNENTIGSVWKSLSDKLNLKKGQRFKHKLNSDFDRFFNPAATGGISEKDAITGEELLGKAVDLDGHLVNQYTYDQIELGKQLRKVDYWVMSEEPLTFFSQQSFNPVNIGKYNYFVSAGEIEKKKEQLRASTEKVRIIAINKLNFLETPQKGIDNIYGYTFYGGNDFPVSNRHDAPKTFEELAGIVFDDKDQEKRKSSPGLVRMGVLRMDVDNLGAMFRRGLPADKRTFSKYSVLSRSLDYFFKGYINEIWKNDDSFRNFTQVIYSGGDDLFVIGKWDVLIRMAEAINSAFRQWTCNNPELTLSGGISIVQPKFPVIKAALMSEKEEKNAKNHRYGELEKNSFSVFGYAFAWETEWLFIRDLKNQVKSLLEDKQGGLSQGFPAYMYNLMLQAEFTMNEAEQRYSINNFEVIWLSAYSFRRSVKRMQDQTAKLFLEKWVNLIFTGKVPALPDTKYHALQFLALASRWASLESR